VAGAIVDIEYGGPVTTAYQTMRLPPPVGPPPAVPRRVITDAQGQFFFRQLAGGRYLTTVSAPGYLLGGYLQLKPSGTLHYLDLIEDAARTDIVIRLWKYAAVSGTVLDEHGEPAVGAVVHVMVRAMVGGQPRITTNIKATTDDRGIYRVSGLVPDTYVVGVTTVGSAMPAETVDAYAAGARSGDGSAQAIAIPLGSSGSGPPISAGIRVGALVLDADVAKTGFGIPQPGADGKVLAYATTYYPSAPTSAQATPIVLHAGEERTDVDLSLRLAVTARASGTVTGPGGPAANTAVRLVPQTGIDFASENAAEIATTVTDGSGAFTLLAVPPGDYSLKVLKSSPNALAAARQAFAAGLGAAPSPMPSPPASTEPTLWATLPVQVAESDVTGLAVVLRNGLRVRGRVQFEGKKDKPLPEEMARIAITLAPIGARPAAPFPPGRATPDGDFATADYPPGQYFVNANMPGWTLARVMRGAANVADAPLDLDARDVDGVTVVFTDQAATIGGHVTDTAGVADTTADVIAFPADSDAWRQAPFSPRRYRTLSTTKAGDYEFAGLPAGDYFIVAVKNELTDNWQDPKFLEKLTGLATRATLKDGDKVQLALKTVTVKR
jgi:hypothetical protein